MPTSFAARRAPNMFWFEQTISAVGAAGATVQA
jgi:hypothetical protein